VGEDGCLQGLLETLGVSYVGSEVLASALAASKPHAKRVFSAAGLPIARDALVRTGDDLGARARALRAELGRALVVKPASGGSAIGVELLSASESDEAVEAALQRVLALDPVALVEPLVPGREVTCGVLERSGRPGALPPTLIVPASEYYDFESKYRAGGSEHRCPAPFAAELSERIQRAAVTAHLALGCRDLSRTDFLVDSERATFILLETNTLPGMTPTSLFPEAAAVTGIPFEALCDELVRTAAARPRRLRPAVSAMP
jgi:D-alanine-D-alanine ligase